MYRAVWRHLVAGLSAVAVATGMFTAGVIAPAHADETVVEPTPSVSVPASEYSVAVAIPKQQWWRGKRLPVAIDSWFAGEPVEGRFVVSIGGQKQNWEGSALRRWLPTSDLSPGTHEIKVELSVRDAESGRWGPVASAATQVHIQEPAVPVLTPPSTYAGHPVTLRFDVTGTDEPRTGAVTFRGEGGRAIATATLDDGVASATVDPGVVSALLRVVGIQHRDADTGEEIGYWYADFDVQLNPVEVTATVPPSWEAWSPLEIPVRASSEFGVPGGVVRIVDRNALAGSSGLLGQAQLVDGAAVVHVDPSSIRIDGTRIDVIYSPSSNLWYSGGSHSYPVYVDHPDYTVTNLYSSNGEWTYGKSRRVTFTVWSPRSTPTGRVELWSENRKVGSATLVGGRASILIRGDQLEPGNRVLEARYVGPPSYASSTFSWNARVGRAQPTVRLTMDRTSYPARAYLGADEPGTVRVSTVGLPERGRLVLETRNPGAGETWWRTRSGVNWTLTTSESGVQKVKIPAQYLRTAGGRPGSVYLRVRYLPSDTSRATAAVSPAVAIRRT